MEIRENSQSGWCCDEKSAWPVWRISWRSYSESTLRLLPGKIQILRKNGTYEEVEFRSPPPPVVFFPLKISTDRSPFQHVRAQRDVHVPTHCGAAKERFSVECRERNKNKNNPRLEKMTKCFIFQMQEEKRRTPANSPQLTTSFMMDDTD